MNGTSGSGLGFSKERAFKLYNPMRRTTPKVSVVIPTYNSAAYLPETIASVTAQSFQYFEIVIVDDGSTDQTKSVVEKSDRRIKYVFQEHSGIPAKARNKALDLARGEFVAFLDSDDLWESEKLERQVQVMERQPEISVCFTDHSTFGAFEDNRTAFDHARRNLDRLEKKRIGADSYLITSPTLLEDCLMRGPIPLWTSTILLRRACLEAVGKFNEEMPLDDDTQMWLRLAKQCRVGYIDKVLARRRIRASSITAGINQRKEFVYSLRSLETLDQWIPLSKVERSAVKKRIAQITFSVGYDDFTRDNLKGARQWFWSSLNRQFSWRTMQFLLYTSMPLGTLRGLRSLKHRFVRNPGQVG